MQVFNVQSKKKKLTDSQLHTISETTSNGKTIKQIDERNYK